MYNWSVNTKRLQKDTDAMKRWETEQLINFGLQDNKLDSDYLAKNIASLRIDPKKKKFLYFLLCDHKD